MKQKSVGFYGSSLEMLLDTMCAMLGGVVFIALTVALFSRTATAQSPEQYQQQAAALSNELAAVTASNSVVEAQLLATLQHLQDPHQHFRTNAMRLPILSSTTKQPWTVIIRYGKLYPLYLLSSGERGPQRVRNQALLWHTQSIIEPRPEQGDSPEDGVLQMARAFKLEHHTNFFFAFAVYPDSFDAFIRAREIAATNGFQYGWTPLEETEDKRLQLVEHGEHILPQN